MLFFLQNQNNLAFSFISEGYAPCKIELDDLISKKKREFGQKSRGKIGAVVSERMNSISGWKPKGMLVAHLHEHQVKKLGCFNKDKNFCTFWK